MTETMATPDHPTPLEARPPRVPRHHWVRCPTCGREDTFCTVHGVCVDYRCENRACTEVVDTPAPLEAREALVTLIRARAPRAEIERAADEYIAAIKRRAQATKR